MKKIIYLLVSFICTYNYIYAQEKSTLKTTISKTFESKSKFGDQHVFTDNNSNIIVLTEKDKSLHTEFHVQKFNQNLELLKEDDFSFTNTNNYPLVLSTIIKIKNRVFFVSTYFNEPKKKSYLFAQEFDLNTLKIKEDIISICDFQFDNAPKPFLLDIEHTTSIDTSKIVFYYNYSNELTNVNTDKNKNVITDFVVLDKDLNKIYQKRDEFPYLNLNFRISRLIVDNNANVYYEALKYIDEKQNDYELSVFLSNEKELIENEIILNDELKLKQIETYIDLNNNCKCIGFYSENNKNIINGFCNMKLNFRTNQIEIYNYKQLLSTSVKYRDKNEAIVEKKMNSKGYRYGIHNIIFKPNNEYSIVLEEWVNSNENPEISYTDFGDHDIVIANISDSNTIETFSTISKKDFYTTKKTYFFNVYNNNLYFFFNDDPKHFGVDKPITCYNNLEQNCITQIQIDSKNVIKKNIVTNLAPRLSILELEIFVFYPENSVQLSENQAVFFCSKLKNSNLSFYFIKLDF